jgi:hypothetical protein
MWELEKESALAPVSTENLPSPDPCLHHQLSYHRNSPMYIHKLLQDNKNYLAFKMHVCMSLHVLTNQLILQGIHPKTQGPHIVLLMDAR